MIQSCCCWNLTGRKKNVAGTSLHTILPSVAHLLPRGRVTCCGLSWTGPSQADELFFFLFFFLFFLNNSTEYGLYFSIKSFQPTLNPTHTFSVPHLHHVPFVYPLDVVQLLAKNSKAKKISFLLISCSLQRFYFVLKKGKKGTKTKVLWRNPTVAQL